MTSRYAPGYAGHLKMIGLSVLNQNVKSLIFSCDFESVFYEFYFKNMILGKNFILLCFIHANSRNFHIYHVVVVRMYIHLNCTGFLLVHLALCVNLNKICNRFVSIGCNATK